MDKEELRKKAISRTRDELETSVDKDELLVKAVKQLDQLNKNFTEEMERFRDWYSLHFPELESEIVDDHELLKIIKKYGLDRDDIEPFQELAEGSTGTKLTDQDEKLLKQTVSHLSGMEDLKDDLEDYVRSDAETEFQNLSSLLGPLLATRLVSLAGGLEELAKKPASTVQMLGAEKALFRYLHGEGTPPKHGILFEHQFVKSLPEEKRGKMARFLANKTVMAARIDQYGDEDKSKGLNEEIQDKYDELREE